MSEEKIAELEAEVERLTTFYENPRTEEEWKATAHNLRLRAQDFCDKWNEWREKLAVAERERDEARAERDRMVDAYNDIDPHIGEPLTLAARLEQTERERIEAAERERAGVVRWLRDEFGPTREDVRWLADAIERGEHLEASDV